jgi:hypothetical protein
VDSQRQQLAELVDAITAADNRVSDLLDSLSDLQATAVLLIALFQGARDEAALAVQQIHRQARAQAS